jgi:hypothetical protein
MLANLALQYRFYGTVDKTLIIRTENKKRMHSHLQSRETDAFSSAKQLFSTVLDIQKVILQYNTKVHTGKEPNQKTDLIKCSVADIPE